MLRLVISLGGAVAITLLATSVPVAMGQWYDKGTPLEYYEDPTSEATGYIAVSSSGGGVHCSSGTMTYEIWGGTAFGLTYVKTFWVESPKSCEVSGGLSFLTGGTTTLKTVTLTGTPYASSSEVGVYVSGILIHTEFTNGFKLTLSSIEGSPLVATPDNTTSITSISSFAFSGELNSTLSAGKMKVVGSLTVLEPDTGTYGLVK
jgi:hypothetical protein